VITFPSVMPKAANVTLFVTGVTATHEPAQADDATKRPDIAADANKRLRIFYLPLKVLEVVNVMQSSARACVKAHGDSCRNLKAE
jgi:hypothetical protein